MVEPDDVEPTKETRAFWIQTYLEEKHRIEGRGNVTERDFKKFYIALEIAITVSWKNYKT